MPANSSEALPAFLRLSKADLHNKFIDLEWQQRQRLLEGQQEPAQTGKSKFSRLTGDHISTRNRYLNVEPFAQNRIKLRVGAGANDYINASPIRLGNRYYIATQGPKDTSMTHFYRMLKSEISGAAVVIMLTQTHETGKEKCYEYYPLTEKESPLSIPKDTESGDGFAGEVELISCQSDEASRSQVRRLRLHTSTETGTQEDKDIIHLLFSGWPDFLVPEGDDKAALLKLIQLSARLNSKQSTSSSAELTSQTIAQDLSATEQDNPRVIHCSAGVGRSGTFIALDYLLGQLHSGQFDNLPASRDPVADTVDSLRQQRMMMVQGEQQFYFVYDVLREQYVTRAKARQPGA